MHPHARNWDRTRALSVTRQTLYHADIQVTSIAREYERGTTLIIAKLHRNTVDSESLTRLHQ